MVDYKPLDEEPLQPEICHLSHSCVKCYNTAESSAAAPYKTSTFQFKESSEFQIIKELM